MQMAETLVLESIAVALQVVHEQESGIRSEARTQSQAVWTEGILIANAKFPTLALKV